MTDCTTAFSRSLVNSDQTAALSTIVTAVDLELLRRLEGQDHDSEPNVIRCHLPVRALRLKFNTTCFPSFCTNTSGYEKRGR